MIEVDDQINILDQSIYKIIDQCDKNGRGFTSQNILDKLRTFVEVISVKVTGEVNYSYDIFQNKAKNYVASRHDTKFLSRLHKWLQTSKSHYATSEEGSERLMLKYYEYLLKIKVFMKKNYNIDVLQNINKLSTTTNRSSEQYYKEIASKIKKPGLIKSGDEYNDRFYILKVKSFFIDQEIFYEVTFKIANSVASKSDRIIAFTSLDISQNYSVKMAIRHDYINIFGKRMPIQIIDNWKVSVRPCELQNFESIFNENSKTYYTKNIEYIEIMSYLTKTGLNLVEIIDFSDDYYSVFKNNIAKKSDTIRIISLLDKSREIIKKNAPGSNILRYLLYNLNNRIVKQQYERANNPSLSGLNLSNKCIPFDEMPFASSLVKHNPSIFDLIDCIDVSGREHELFARRILNNAEIKGWLYTPFEDVEQFGDVDKILNKFNGLLYQGAEAQRERALLKYKDNISIAGYENAVLKIIEKLKELSTQGIKNYSNSIKTWLSSPESNVDCEQKKEVLKLMFENTKVSLIYGSAGTGKTKLIEHIARYYNERTKLILAKTHSAISNLKTRITAKNAELMTLDSFLRKSEITDIDILIIDECSIVSNKDMYKILSRNLTFGALVLVGDIFQIESIRFGNWFYLAKNFLPKYSVVELTAPWRAKDNEDLLGLWNKVRNIDGDIAEYLIKNGYSACLDNSIFTNFEDDEIILCLNYDGFYGINNINRFLQENNKNEPIVWGVYTYKINDPIVFNESKRFGTVIYNNLKGKILNINKQDSYIQFDIQIDKSLSELDIRDCDGLELLNSIEEAKSVIRFSVNKWRNTDEDDDDTTSDIVPFQIAYAVSIHKAQGLEYDSVKLIITDEMEDRISHNIFYTAITRAKKKLKIYWSPESQVKILNRLEKKFNKKDADLLKSKYKL